MSYTSSGPSPFYTNQAIGQGISNLARAFGGDPNAELRRQQMELAKSQMGTQELKQQQIGQQLAGSRSLSDALRGGFPDGGDPSQAARNVYAAAAQGGDAAVLAALPKVFTAYTSTQPGVPAETLDRLVVGSGGDWGNTQNGVQYSTGVASGDRRYSADRSAGAQVASARIGADASIKREGMAQAGEDRRMRVTLAPGQVSYVPENSPVASRTSDGGVLRGDQRAQTTDQARAAYVPQYVAGSLPPDQMGRARELLAPSVAAADARGGGAARSLSASDMKTLDTEIGAITSDADGDFTLTPAAQAAIRTRAAQLYQSGPGEVRGNPGLAAQQAMQEYMQANPPRTDSRLNPLSARTYGVPASQVPAAPGAGKPAALDAGGPAEGQTATNPQTGQKIIFRGGRWVPLA